MKIRLCDVFYGKPRKELIVSNQKELESIFGKCFLVFSDPNSYDGLISLSDILVYSRHKIGYGWYNLYGISSTPDYDEKELDKFVFSKTFLEFDIKKSFLKHRIKKII